MSVSAQETIFHHVGNGVTVTFAFNCQVLLAADLNVYVDDTLVSSGFSVSGIGALTGGSVTFDAPPASLAQVRLERDIVLERLTDYQQNGDFLARVVNPDFNRLWMALQQHLTTLSRALKVPKSDAVAPTDLPTAAARANKLLSFDADGNPVAVAPDAQSATALQTLLALFSGSSLIGFIQAGVGALLQTVQGKLRSMLIDRNDFGTLAQFNTAAAAAPTTPTLDENRNYGAKITPFAEPTQLDLKSALLTVAVGPRDALVYRGATSVTVSRKYAVMGGFRYRGQYTRGRAPMFPMPASLVADCAAAGLGAETAFRTENWYAAFACAAAGDAAAAIKTMPFLRVASVAGSIVSLNRAGEGIHVVSAQTYAWNAIDNLVGTECLVISEAGAWSGRVTTITANGAGYVTLANVGTLAFGDFLLPAPPGKAHYVYLCSWYMDTVAVRNVYDAGTLVKGKMIYPTTPNIAAGAFAAPGQVMNCAGYISPLATAVVLDSSATLATAATGDVAEYFDPDGANHPVQSPYYDKSSATSSTYVFTNMQIPFLYYQKFNYYNGGSRAASRTNGQLNITGWFEP